MLRVRLPQPMLWAKRQCTLQPHGAPYSGSVRRCCVAQAAHDESQ